MSDNQLPPPPPVPGAAPEPPAKPKKRGRKPVKAGLSLAEQEQARLHAALFAGFVIYLENPGMSVTAVWEAGRIAADDAAPFIRDCVAHETFVKHATANAWVSRRERHWAEVRSRVQARLMQDHVQKSLDNLTTIEAAKGVAMQHIRGDAAAGIIAAKPKSLEGVLGSLAQLTKVEIELRKVVMEQVADAAEADARIVKTDDPQLPGAPAALVADDDGFSDEEIEAMARAAAMKNAYGSEHRPAQLPGPAPAPAPPPPPEGDNGKVNGDNEKLLRPVMEPP